MPKIYESPDKGKTVFEREMGSTERTQISMNEDYITDTSGMIYSDSIMSPTYNITIGDPSENTIFTKYPDLQTTEVKSNLGVDVIYDIKKIIDGEE